jgi:nucleosome binding factor SPN SPT16 subunit
LTVFTSNQRIGSLSKETYAGKLIDEWNNALTSSNKKPEVVDIASAISTFMSVKDDEELVRRLININILFGCDVHS